MDTIPKLPDNDLTKANQRITNLEKQVETLIKEVYELKEAHRDEYEHKCYLANQ